MNKSNTKLILVKCNNAYYRNIDIKAAKDALKFILNSYAKDFVYDVVIAIDDIGQNKFVLSSPDNLTSDVDLSIFTNRLAGLLNRWLIQKL